MELSNPDAPMGLEYVPIHLDGICTYIWLKLIVNVGKYSIHGAYGYENG